MHMWGEWVIHAHVGVGGVGDPCTCGGGGSG